MARVQDRSGFDTDTRMTLLEGDADHLESTVAGIQASMKKLSTALNAHWGPPQSYSQLTCSPSVKGPMYLLTHENPNAPIRANGLRGWYYPSRNKQIRGITVHSPQALDPARVGDGTAEAVAKYFASVKRPASAHVNIDSDSIVELLPDDYTAFHAAGVNSETLGAESGWLFDSWNDNPEKTDQVIRLFAQWAAPKCVAYDIPVARVPLKADWDNGARGFLEHSLTEGWRGQAGRRRDPGPDFPWELFFTYLTNAIDRLDGESMIKTGDTGFMVSKIQKALNGWSTLWGVGLSVTVDGVYGEQTRTAVFKWQEGATRPTTGEVDGIMMAALMEYVPDWIDTHTPPATLINPGIISGSEITITGNDFNFNGKIYERQQS